MRWDSAVVRPLTPLPRSLDPLTGESLAGYVLRLAHRLHRSPDRLATITGLTARPAGSRLGGHLIHLDQGTIAGFATVTKLKPDEVERLGLAGLTSHYAPLSPQYLGRNRSPDRLATTEPWIFGRWSRYCPSCLAGDDSAIQRAHGGAWQRLWRLPPVFACITHQCLLEDRCPACQRPAASLDRTHESLVGCPRVEGLHPAQCRNRLPGPTPAGVSVVCGVRLDTAHTAATAGTDLLDFLLTVQHRLLRLLDPENPAEPVSCGEPTTADRYFTDLRLLTNLICVTWPAARPMTHYKLQAAAIDEHVAERRHVIRHAESTYAKTQRHAIYDRPPARSLTCGSLLALAEHLLHADDAGRYLGQLIGGRATANWAAHFLHGHAYCSPGLRYAAEPYVQAYRTGKPGRPKLIGPHRPPRQPNAQRPRPCATPRPQPPRRKVAAPRPPQPPAATPRRRPTPPKPRLTAALPALVPVDGPVGYTHEHVPAFLPLDWQQHYLPAVTSIADRYLRRTASVLLVLHAERCTAEQAAMLLGLSPEPVLTAYRQFRSWARHHADAAAVLRALQTLATDLGNQHAKVNYAARRRALTSWQIPAEHWQHIVDHLHQAARPGTRHQSDWGERKRNTASAFVWVRATQGEHLFAPHRYSPGARPGSTDDRGLSIDRAWWRSNNPGSHYAKLKTRCTQVADEICAAIDTC